MNKQELVSEESKQASCTISWVKLLKIAAVILIVVLLFLLVKDYLLTEEVSIGVASPSEIQLSAVKGLEVPSPAAK